MSTLSGNAKQTGAEVVERGRFGADMKVSLVNDGPFITIILGFGELDSGQRNTFQSVMCPLVLLVKISN